MSAPHRTATPPTPLPPPPWRFPDPRAAGPGGAIAVGADLEPATLVHAYRHGMFPWPHPGRGGPSAGRSGRGAATGEGPRHHNPTGMDGGGHRTGPATSRSNTPMPLPWFSPDPRAVITRDSIHVSRSLRRRLRHCGWTTTVDRAFDAVIEGCREGRPETWITPQMVGAYRRLAQLGWAHSVEVWTRETTLPPAREPTSGPRRPAEAKANSTSRGQSGDATLVGGLYGVQVGGCFTGESMFHRRDDASKVALVDLVERFTAAGGSFLDAQLPTDHLRRLGAREVPRAVFLARLAAVRDDDVRLAVEERDPARLAAL